jgi:hypothetical protein
MLPVRALAPANRRATATVIQEAEPYAHEMAFHQSPEGMATDDWYCSTRLGELVEAGTGEVLTSMRMQGRDW